MDADVRCLGCMRLSTGAGPCPHCGWSEEVAVVAPYHLPPGTRIADRYLVGRVIDEGPYGISYLGYDQNRHQKVTVKEFFPARICTRKPGSFDVACEDGGAQNDFVFGMGKFIEEGMALQSMQAMTGIPRVPDLFKANQSAYLILRYIDGDTLTDFMEQNGGQISFGLILKILEPVMTAIAEVHEKGLLHYDIHPDNILVSEGHLGTLVNFDASGYAIAHSQELLSGALRPGYAAPETYDDLDEHGPWTDVYSMAATIYRGLTGREVPSAADRSHRDRLERPSRLGKPVSIEAEKTLMRALSMRPAMRYRTMAEFRDELFNSQSALERERLAAAKDAFTTATCPNCDGDNDVLINDLRTGNTRCATCQKPLWLDGSGQISNEPPAPPSLTRRKLRGKRKAPETGIVTITCPVCRSDNEVAVPDIKLGITCRDCGTDLPGSPSEMPDTPTRFTAITPPVGGPRPAARSERTDTEAVAEIEAALSEIPDTAEVDEARPADSDETDTGAIDAAFSEDTDAIPTETDDDRSVDLSGEDAGTAPETETDEPADAAAAESDREAWDSEVFNADLREVAPSDAPSEAAAPPDEPAATPPETGPPTEVEPPSDTPAEREEAVVDTSDATLVDTPHPAAADIDDTVPDDLAEEDVPVEPLDTGERETGILPSPPLESDDDERITPVDCPRCHVRNEVPIDQLFKGAACRECGFEFMSSSLLEDSPPADTAPVAAGRGIGKWLAVAAVALVLVIAGAGGWFWWQSGQTVRAQYAVHITAGDLALDQRRYAEALAQFQAAAALDSSDPDLTDRLRTTREAMAEFEASENAAREAFIAAESRIFQGDSLFDLERYAAARDQYSAALEEFPNDDYILAQLSEIDARTRESAASTPVARTPAPPKPRVRLTADSDIQQAIDRAAVNSILKLPTGLISLPAPLVIRKPLELVGDGPNHTLLVALGGEVVIDIQNTRGVKLTGIGFEHQAETARQLVVVENAQVSLANCSFKGIGGGNGLTRDGVALLFAGKSSGSVSGSRFSGNRVGLMVRDGAQPTVTDCELWENEQGMVIVDDARPRLRANRIRNNRGDGLVIAGNARPSAEGNEIVSNGRNGIHVDGTRFNGELKGNEIVQNGEVGVLVVGSSQPTLEGNEIRRNRGGGIYFRDQARGVARDNRILENGTGGIKVFNTSQPTITGNTIQANEGDGIELLNATTANVDRNEITKNRGDGISILMDKSGGFVRNNTSTGNQGYGISILRAGKPTIMNNATAGNREGNVYEEEPSS